MTIGVAFDNLVAYSLQIGMLVGVAAVVPGLLRLRQPGAKLTYWQILLAACLLLPLQPWKQIAASGTVEVTTAIAAVQPVHSTRAAAILPRAEIAFLILLAGVLVRLGWLAVGFWKLRRYRRHSRPLEPSSAWSVEATLLVSEDIASPVTFGWRRPVVLLPANFEMLDGKTQEAILCHEIMHVRRGDWLFTVAEEVVRAAFWFHPAIWWLLGEIGLAREQEVDRLAIDITQQREEYMDALLAIAGAGGQLDLAPAPLFLRKRHLRHRVILILKEARMSKVRMISTLTTGLAVLAAACWLVTGAFPLTAEPQVVSDAAGVTVNMNGSTLLHRLPVHYPAAAIEHGVQGTLSVQVKLDANGNVADAQVLAGPDELRRAALESVLEWHFTRDEANTTRVVQIEFQLPKPVTASGTTAPETFQGLVVVAGQKAVTPSHFHITGITVAGLTEEAKEALLATLPVHSGDILTNTQLNQVTNAAKAFDEHLTVRRLVQNPSEGDTVDAGLIISRIGPEIQRTMVMPQAPMPPAATSDNPNDPRRIRVGGAVIAAQIIRKVAPEYPGLAKMARVSGVVHLDVIIGEDGTVQEIHSLGGPALLIQAAMDAVRQWAYKPTLLNGKAVMVETTVDVNFTLNE